MQLSDLGLTREQAEESVLFIDGDCVLSGSRAVAAILRSGRWPWPWIGAVVDFPVVRPVAQVGYRLVARYRGRLPGVRPVLTE
jgi:predicted DCC family thiol-disulfide oxidoreductase YuxK